MDVLIRDIAPSVVKTIDEKAKSRGKSRNEYLKTMLERSAVIDAFYDERNEYVSLVKSMETILKHNAETLRYYQDTLDRLEVYLENAERLKSNITQ